MRARNDNIDLDLARGPGGFADGCRCLFGEEEVWPVWKNDLGPATRESLIAIKAAVQHVQQPCTAARQRGRRTGSA